MRLTFSILSIMSLGCALVAQGGEPVLRGEAFPAKGGQAPVFMVERGVKETERGRVYFDRYTDQNGQLATSIEAAYESGKLVTVKFDQHQLGETSTAEMNHGKVTYSHTSGGKTKQSTEKDTGEMVAAPAIPDFIISKWNELQAGKAVEFTMPIPARHQALDFKLSKEKGWSQSGRAFTEIRMEPSNPIFRTLGEPGYFVFDDQSKTLVEYRGRTVAKTGTAGNWKDFSGRIVYRQAAKTTK